MAYRRVVIISGIGLMALLSAISWYCWKPDTREKIVYPKFDVRSDAEPVVESFESVIPTDDATKAKTLGHPVELSKGQTFRLTGQLASGTKITTVNEYLLIVEFFVTDPTGKELFLNTGTGTFEINPKDPNDIKFDISIAAPSQLGRCRFRLSSIDRRILCIGEAIIR